MSGLRKHGYEGNEVAMPWEDQVVSSNEARAAALDARKRGLVAALRNAFAETLAACGAFEWVALTYLGISSALIMAFAQNLAHPLRLLGVQIFVAAVIVTLCRAATPSVSYVLAHTDVAPPFTYRVWHFWRHWYPHLFFLFCFEELGYLMRLVTPAWQDPKLIAFDYWLTGVHPVVWLEQFATPSRNEFMQFAYITYFVYLLVLGGILYYRKDWHAYWSVMTYSAVGYAIGYVIAVFFPVQSPWFAMAGSWHAELPGGRFTALINFIEHYGRVRGAAFPSEHVAGSFAALWGAWRHRRWLFWVMLPFVLCMCFSTIWGRYHYVADIFAGIITGTLGYVIGAWIMRKTERQPVIKSTLEEVRHEKMARSLGLKRHQAKTLYPGAAGFRTFRYWR